MLAVSGLVVATSPPTPPPFYFEGTSYWNTAVSAAPIDPSSRTWINRMRAVSAYLELVDPNNTAWATPVYDATASDPLCLETDGVRPVYVHIPPGAQPSTGSDAALVIFDEALGRVVGLHGAVRGGACFTVDGVDHYENASNGLQYNVAGSDCTGYDPDGFRRCIGHRGIPANIRQVMASELTAGTITHRLELYIPNTEGPTPCYWPMLNCEARGGNIPEGTVIRLKPTVNCGALFPNAGAPRTICRALQTYGAIIGDTSGSTARLKIESFVSSGRDFGLTQDSLSPLAWSKFEFIRAGCRLTNGGTGC